MFAKIIIGACIVAVARAGLLAQPALATAYAAPAAYGGYAGYAAAPVYGYAAAPAYAAHGYTNTIGAPAYAAHGYGAGAYGYGSHYDQHAVAHTAENTYRSHDHTVSSQSRTIATPYSSSSKQFTKVTNAGLYAAATPIAIAHHGAYAAPIAAHATYAAAPIAAHAAYAAPIATHTTYTHAAPIAHAAIAAPIAAHGYPALGYAAGHTYGHGAGLLGAAYSPAYGTSHVAYSSSLGAHYGY